jgi:hypothetical protein
MTWKGYKGVDIDLLRIYCVCCLLWWRAGMFDKAELESFPTMGLGKHGKHHRAPFAVFI